MVKNGTMNHQKIIWEEEIENERPKVNSSTGINLPIGNLISIIGTCLVAALVWFFYY